MTTAARRQTAAWKVVVESEDVTGARVYTVALHVIAYSNFVGRTRVASKCNLLSQTFVQPEDNLIPEQGRYVQANQ